MAKNTKKGKKQTVKLIKKKWYDIYSSGYYNVKIGETLLSDPQKMIGKDIKIILMNITNNIRQQHINLYYKITKIEGEKGIAEWKGYELNSAYVKRFVRRKTTRIDNSFVIKTKDEKKIRIKPLIITRHKVSSTLKSEIRKAATAFLVERINSLEKKEILGEIINKKLTNDLKNELKSYAPIKIVEIRSIKETKKGKIITLEGLKTKKVATKKITKTAKRTMKKTRPKQNTEETPIEIVQEE